MDDLNKQWYNLCNAEQIQKERRMLDQLEQMSAANRASINPPKKEHSLVKGAIVGGIVAGPAGAIVGALVQKDKNDRGK